MTVHDLVMGSEPWGGPGKRQKRSWRLVTLTSRADADEGARWNPAALREAVKAVGDALPKWWRRTPWGRQTRNGAGTKRSRTDTSAAAAQEIASGGMVHWHLIVYGEYVPQRILADAWSWALGVSGAIVDVRSVEGNDVAGGIREALKYATKGAGNDQPARAAAVEFAFGNVKRVRTYGALRTIQGRSAEADSDDSTAEDVHDHHEATCEACGVIGSWRWVQTSAGPELVTRNGGWGILVVPLRPDGLTGGSRAPPSASRPVITDRLPTRDHRSAPETKPSEAA